MRLEKNGGGVSPGCAWQLEKSMVLPSNLGGVPVLSLPVCTPSDCRRCDNPIAGASSIRPAGILSKPLYINPLRNVPAVMMTVWEAIF